MSRRRKLAALAAGLLAGDGHLANGKPVTEQNVLELLHQIETDWPTGSWTTTGSAGNTGAAATPPWSVL